MNGTGRSSGAITIVNALFTGVGAAAAISLPVEAWVSLDERPHADPGRLDLPAGSATPLVRRTLAHGLEALAPGRSFDVSLTLHSAIPPARGLKSSSAVSSAILFALADALGRPSAPLEIAGLAASVGVEVGLSATGAFDDALAASAGGAVVTDNRRRAFLRRLPLEVSERVLLWIPPGPHRPSPQWAQAFERRAAEGRAAAELALRGEPWPALERNTELVEQVMGYRDYRALREELRRQGARGAGVSGMGPTLAAVVPAERVDRLRRVLPAGPEQVLVVEFLPGVEVGR